jgi:hypothetical protein
MTSPAHRAAVGFFQGGLVAVVAQVVASPLAGAVAAVSAWSPLAPLVRILIPLAGLAVAGAVGGEAMERGRRGVRSFALGGLAAGVVLMTASPNLSGLTGYENPLIVLAYATTTAAAAFGILGFVGGLGLVRTARARAAVAFAIGGAAGGLLGTVPFLLARYGPAGAAGPVAQFVFLASAVGSIAVPLALGGALTARALNDG